jgi:hypothetical protein
MTSDLANKVESTARHLRFKQSKEHKSQGQTTLTYESIVGFHFDYPKNLFLINKNMIFNKGLEDSSYDVYKFSENGSYNKIPTETLDIKFFNSIKTIKTI